MYIYMLFCVKRMEQRDILYDEFYENYRSLVRDCRIIESGRSRDLELVFKAEDEKPFISFAQKALQVHDFITPDIEFAYDDGQFHFLFIDEKKVKEEDRHFWDFTSELTYSRTFFGTDEDFSKIVEEWAKEIHADDEQKKAKLSRLQKGKEQWEEELERDRKRLEKKQKSKEQGSVFAPETEPGSNTRTSIKYRLPPNLTKSKVIEIIQKLNTSGEVIIPIYILREEIDTGLTKNDMIDRFLFIERSTLKAELFSALKAGLAEYDKQPA